MATSKLRDKGTTGISGGARAGLALPPGEHQLNARSDSSAELDVSFTTIENEPLWALLEYSAGVAECPNFAFQTSDEPFAFV